jgi:hypothetical protein
MAGGCRLQVVLKAAVVYCMQSGVYYPTTWEFAGAPSVPLVERSRIRCSPIVLSESGWEASIATAQ